MADSLGDRQFSPKPPASAWSGTFWSHRRADQEALTPALPACLSRARTQDSGNCSLQGGTTGSLVQGFGHSIYFLILTQAIQETLNLNKRSVPWPGPLSNTIATSALMSILPGANCAFCTPSPATRGQPPPSAEIYAFPNTRTGSQSHHRLVPEVQRLRQAWVGAISTFQSSHPCGWLVDGGILAAWGGGPEQGVGAFWEGPWPDEAQQDPPKLVVPPPLSPVLKCWGRGCI